MNRSLVAPIVTALAFATACATALSAERSYPAGEVDILVNGAPQPRYAQDGRWYVEAVKGREYAIRLHNPYGVRVAVALSVDGLNTIDARRSTATDARKWVIDPYATITISGWQTSQASARRFEFTTEERSYAQALGSPSDMGVISAVYFRERVRPAVATPESSESRRRPDATGARAGGAAPGAAHGSPANKQERDEYAATGMGRQTDHAITQIWLDLEDAPAQRTDIRYEFRPQLVKLGILPAGRTADPLQRRERANGFEPGFSPEPPRGR